MLSIPPHSLHMMVIIVLALTIGTLCYLFLSRRHPERDYQELKLRIRSWWWMIGIVFIALYLPTSYTLIFVAFLSFMAFKEFLSIVPTRMADRRVIFWRFHSSITGFLLVGTACSLFLFLCTCFCIYQWWLC